MISIFCWISHAVTADCLLLSFVATVAVVGSVVYATRISNSEEFKSERALVFFTITAMLSGICFIFVILKVLFSISGMVSNCDALGLSVRQCFAFQDTSFFSGSTMYELTDALV